MDLKAVEFAHDLKVPLQLIASCVQLLELEMEANTRTEAYLKTLARSAEQMQNMLARALDEEELRCGRRDVVAEAREVAREFALLAERRGIRVSFDSNASRFCMNTDGEKLRRMLHNLLSNALRYTPPGGRIALRTRLMGDSVEFSVSDTGCGMNEGMQRRVFEPGVSDCGGGKGLAIVKKYSEMLGGGVSVCSKPGMGSCFTIRLPVR